MESDPNIDQQGVIEAAIAYAQARQVINEIERGKKPWPDHWHEFDVLIQAEDQLLRSVGMYSRPGYKCVQNSSNAGMQLPDRNAITATIVRS